MNHYENFLNLKQFTDRIGPIYGTEDLGIYLYSIVKMLKPKNVIELGTGLGTTMLWISQALVENDEARIYLKYDWKHIELLLKHRPGPNIVIPLGPRQPTPST